MRLSIRLYVTKDITVMFVIDLLPQILYIDICSAVKSVPRCNCDSQLHRERRFCTLGTVALTACECYKIASHPGDEVCCVYYCTLRRVQCDFRISGGAHWEPPESNRLHVDQLRRGCKVIYCTLGTVLYRNAKCRHRRLHDDAVRDVVQGLYRTCAVLCPCAAVQKIV